MRDLFDELPDVTPEIIPREWLAIEKVGGLDNYYLELLARGSADEVADFEFRSGLGR
jgi:hypothetical protein